MVLASEFLVVFALWHILENIGSLWWRSFLTLMAPMATIVILPNFPVTAQNIWDTLLKSVRKMRNSADLPIVTIYVPLKASNIWLPWTTLVSNVWGTELPNNYQAQLFCKPTNMFNTQKICTSVCIIELDVHLALWSAYKPKRRNFIMFMERLCTWMSKNCFWQMYTFILHNEQHNATNNNLHVWKSIKVQHYPDLLLLLPFLCNLVQYEIFQNKVKRIKACGSLHTNKMFF